MELKDVLFPFSPDAMMQPQHLTETHHLLCHQGNIELVISGTKYNMITGDYAILPNPMLLEQVTWTPDYQGDLMLLSERLIHRIRPHNNYHIFGHLSLLQNPVMHLSERDYQVCTEDIRMIRQRLESPLTDHTHLFYDEMIEHLVMVHVLNIYDIHARILHPEDLSKRSSQLLQQFIHLLDEGHFRKHRDLAFYADRLCITPHYLSEISKKVTHQPASYWIDFYTADEVTRLLIKQQLSFSDIAYQLNFSSLSYFTRYVQKLLGQSPTQFRQRLHLR